MDFNGRTIGVLDQLLWNCYLEIEEQQLNKSSVFIQFKGIVIGLLIFLFFELI